MKKIKKLTLNKEVVSMLGGNEMHRVKGGTGVQTMDIYTCVCDNLGSIIGCQGDFPNDTIPSPTASTCCPPPTILTCPPPTPDTSAVIDNPPATDTQSVYGPTCFRFTCFQEDSCYPCSDM